MEPTAKEAKVPKSNTLENETLSLRTHKVATVILFGLLAALLVGIYFWITAEKQTPIDTVPTRPTYETNREPESVNAQAEVGILQVLSTSDELSAIEADLLSTDLSNLEKELTQIEQELQ